MPRVRRNPRRGRRAVGGLTLYQRAYLLTGQCYDFLVGERDVAGAPFDSFRAARAAWVANRAELEAECEGAEAPWAWFEFEAEAEYPPKRAYFEGFEGHIWWTEYARPASEHPDYEQIRASVTFDPVWIRTWTDVEAVKKGCYFDEKKALHAVGFFRLLRHRVGKWAGRIFDLLPWQRYDVVMPLFGWMGPDGYRRFEKAHIEIPKKNGKSMLCSGLSLYLLIADGESSAEVYNVAGEKEQARIVFAAAQKMAKSSIYLRVIRWTDSKYRGDHDASESFYRLLSADSATKEGYNISGCVIDELHVQKDRELWDALIYGGEARTQCLFAAITTAGVYDPNGIGWEQHEYARRNLSGDGGIGRDIAFFGYIRCLPEELKDRWQEPEMWYRANPSLGVTLDFEKFKHKAEEAANQTSKLNSFLRYRMNMWTQNKQSAFSIQIWNRGAVPGEGLERFRFLEEMARGRECYGGLDLAAVNDLCAASLWFPPANYVPPAEAMGEGVGGEERQEVGLPPTQTGMSEPLGEADIEDMHIWLPYFWLPEENIEDLKHQHNAPYTLWRDEGWLRLTPGSVADYNRIRQDIRALDAEWSPGRWNYDKWGALQLTTQLSETDGLNMVEFGQGYGWMTGPTNELDRLMRSGLIAHPANPALDWMIGNCQATEDHEGRRKLIKADSKRKYKIDGPISGVMALDGAIRCAGLGGVLTGDSVYVG